MDKRMAAAKVWADVRTGLGFIAIVWALGGIVVSLGVVVPVAIMAVRWSWGLL